MEDDSPREIEKPVRVGHIWRERRTGIGHIWQERRTRIGHIVQVEGKDDGSKSSDPRDEPREGDSPDAGA